MLTFNNILILVGVLIILGYVFNLRKTEPYSPIVSRNFYLPTRRHSLIWELGSLVDVNGRRDGEIARKKHVVLNPEGRIDSVRDYAPVSTSSQHCVQSTCPNYFKDSISCWSCR